MSIERDPASMPGHLTKADSVWPGRLRRIIRAGLKLWNQPALVETAELLTTELVTNAFRHGSGTDIGFRLLISGDHVVIEVRDGSPDRPVLRRASPEDEDGRGLALVSAMADEWGTTSDGTTTWCTLPLRKGSDHPMQRTATPVPSLREYPAIQLPGNPNTVTRARTIARSGLTVLDWQGDVHAATEVVAIRRTPQPATLLTEEAKGTVMDWRTRAMRLAGEVVRPESRWHEPVATVPRHEFVPRWWQSDGDAWLLRDGPAAPDAWLEAAYTDQTLVTRVDACPADHAAPGAMASGTPTSSSTLPSLVVRMYRHAMIAENSDVLVTTGTGYGTALACARLGHARVTSIDVDADLVKAASDRLVLVAGYRPQMAVGDITGELPGAYDRIIATVSVRPVPVSWLSALRPGGRLVTTIAGTGLILAADKTNEGGATGRIEWDRAGFMPTRHGADYGPPADDVWQEAAEADGEDVITSRYPLLYPPDAWDVMSMLELQIPGITYRRSMDGGNRTVWLLHPDGSWARATARGFLDSPTVHQGGPRRLWSDLDRIRNRLNREGALPVYGAQVTITPDGTTTLTRGSWSFTL
ncbi:ATP-binding protein [Streptomyces avermitilis]|uniref:ATP-binding protein n=1 Tax=Streptomyces avermitilis TaxID=33903 RepID=UPI0030B85D32